MIFSGEYRLYFNIFFAGIGVLVAQSFAMQYLLSFTALKFHYKQQIMNDNQWFVWVALFFIINGITLLICYHTLFKVDSIVYIIPTVIFIMMVLLRVSLFIKEID